MTRGMLVILWAANIKEMVMEFIKDKFYDEEFSENIFLDSLHNKIVNIFLLSGIKLDGEFCGHDNTSIFLKKGKLDQIVYKNAISTISKSNQKN